MYDDVTVERSEEVEVVLFEYEDDNVSFTISFEFVYTFSKELPVQEDELRVAPLAFIK